VNQNWPGGTIAVRRQTFDEIGGFDEEFVGWGGEDNEFFDRCLSRRFWRHAHLPFVHLWHAEQPRKDDPAYREEARIRLERFLQRDRGERIEALRRRVTVGDGVPAPVRPTAP
jgi:GT2 family glycosyltransferase